MAADEEDNQAEDLARAQKAAPLEPTPPLLDLCPEVRRGPIVPQKPGVSKKLKKRERNQALPLLRPLQPRREGLD